MAVGIHCLLKVHLNDGWNPTPNAALVELKFAVSHMALTTIAQSWSAASGLLQIPWRVCPSMDLQELMPVALYQNSCAVTVFLLSFRVEQLKILVTNILNAASCSHKSMPRLNLFFFQGQIRRSCPRECMQRSRTSRRNSEIGRQLHKT